jgi:hypothetical protein
LIVIVVATTWRAEPGAGWRAEPGAGWRAQGEPAKRLAGSQLDRGEVAKTVWQFVIVAQHARQRLRHDLRSRHRLAVVDVPHDPPVAIKPDEPVEIRAGHLPEQHPARFDPRGHRAI